MRHREIDFYEILGLTAAVKQEELRRAYLKLALEFHPDRNSGNRQAEERFKNISQAYAVLSDPSTRKRYDQVRRARVIKHRPNNPFGKTVKKSPAEEYSRQTSSAASAKSSNHSSGPGSSAGSGPKSGSDFNSRQQTKADASFNANTSAKTRAAHHDRATNQRRQSSEPNIDDLMNELFKTPQGQASIEKMQQELEKAGLGLTLDRLKSKLRQPVSGDSLAHAVKNTANRVFRHLKKLKKKVLSNPLAPEFKSLPEDIVFGLDLTPEAAASGTTISITYTRDNQPHRLTIKIPAGVANDTRLRISGQGNLKNRTDRGDLYLHLTIHRAD
jgi:DnaJ-class molecular chaperone